MADRFPSLEEFGDGQTEPKSTGQESMGLDGDDFLTRERALLGDDANQFASANDNSATVEDGDDDLLGGGDSYDGGQAGGEEISQFESSFPAMDSQNEQMGPGGTITGSNLPYHPPQQSSYSRYAEQEEEPEPIR
ncbi:MAG: hypothetical protein L6R39_004714 [Caloplaca ligustica]|nr:MAG: hypothetical protein L6R39_004714 [Caloplaca ligustica]